MVVVFKVSVLIHENAYEVANFIGVYRLINFKILLIVVYLILI